MQKFDDTKNVKTYKDKNIIKRLFKYLKPVKWQFIGALLLTTLIVLVDLIPAYLQGEIIGVLANEDMLNSEKLKIVGILFVSFMGIIIATSVINYFTSMMLQKAGQRIIQNMRRDVFVHIEGLAIAQINATPVGKLVTRVTSDINMINELYTNIIINFIRQVLTLVFTTVVMLIISPILTLYLCIMAPILVVMTLVFKNISRKQYRKVRGCVSNVNAFLSENISGMKITQIFNQEEKKLLEFRQRNDELRKNSIKEILIFGIFRPLIFVLYVVCQIIVLYNGFNLVKAGKIKISSYVSFYKYISSFFNPIQQLAEQFNQL